jgi:hypothetical protein
MPVAIASAPAAEIPACHCHRLRRATAIDFSLGGDGDHFDRARERFIG